MEQIEITVSRRIRTGKNLSRRLRHKGKIPGIVYGLDMQAVPVEIDLQTLRLSKASDNAIWLLKMQGTEATRHVIVKDMQRDPLTGSPMHVDFLRIDLTKEIEVDVPVTVTGTAAGIKEGGLVEFVHRAIRVACLPGDIPEGITIDVTNLHMGDAFRVVEVASIPNVRILTDPDTVLAVVHAPKEEAAPVAAEAAVAAEPEVIGKGKEAKEGAAAGEKGEAKPAAAEGKAPKEKDKEKK
ncbi:MAG: 50S ribosomal protein L25 [Acidobacteriota bacterium]